MSRQTANPPPWTVEVVRVRCRDWCRVKYRGYLHGGGPGWQHGLYATVEQVADLLGEAFARPRGRSQADRPTPLPRRRLTARTSVTETVLQPDVGAGASRRQATRVTVAGESSRR